MHAKNKMMLKITYVKNDRHILKITENDCVAADSVAIDFRRGLNGLRVER